MSTPPFLSRYFIQWLASRTMERAQSVVSQELQSRLESGELGDYQGVLFRNVGQGPSEPRRITAQGVEFGVVASEKRELVGVLDALEGMKSSVGNGLKFYSGALNGCSVVAVETGLGVERSRSGVEALLQAFRPLRVVSVGFARSRADSVASGALFAPSRLVDGDSGAELNLSELVCVADSDASSRSESIALDFLGNFASGALLSFAERFDSSSEFARDVAAYDRSAYTVARACHEVGAPCLILRVIFDAASAARSVEASRVIRSQGSVARSLGALFGATLKKPSAALDVARVKAEEIESADKLARALKRIASLIHSAENASAPGAEVRASDS